MISAKVAGLVLLAILAPTGFLNKQEEAGRTILICRFVAENEAANAKPQYAAALAEQIIWQLHDVPNLNVKNGTLLDSALPSPGSATLELAKAAQRAKSNIALGGTYSIDGDKLTINGFVVNGAGNIETEAQITAEPGEWRSATKKLILALASKAGVEFEANHLAKMDTYVPKSDTLLEQIAKAFAEGISGEDRKAATHFKSLRDSNEPLALACSAVVSFQNGDADIAAQDLSLLKKLDNNAPSTLINLAIAQHASGDNAAARATLKPLLEMTKGFPGAELITAFEAVAGGDIETALKAAKGKPEMLLPVVLRLASGGDKTVAAIWMPGGVLGDIIAAEGEGEGTQLSQLLKPLLADVHLALISYTNGQDITDYKSLRVGATLRDASGHVYPASGVGALLTMFSLDDRKKGKNDDHFVILAFEAKDESGKPILSENSGALTLTLRGFAGAPVRNFTWEQAAKLQAELEATSNEVAAKAQKPKDVPLSAEAALGMMFLQQIKISGTGEHPVAAIWIPTEFITQMLEAQGVAAQPEAEIFLKPLRDHELLLLFAPSLPGDLAPSLNVVWSKLRLSNDLGQAIAPIETGDPLFAEFENMFNLGGEAGQTMLVTFPKKAKDGKPVVAQDAKQLTLSIADYAGAPVRSLTWKLPFTMPEAVKKALKGGRE
jgi:hypothetical protein